MLGRLVNETIKIYGPKYVWGNALSLFSKADFILANLECIISNKGRP